MRFNFRQTERDLTKVAREEYGRDGFACIDSVNISMVETAHLITINGHFGRDGSEEEYNFSEAFEISYLDGKSREFIKGIFSKEIEVRFG